MSKILKLLFIAIISIFLISCNQKNSQAIHYYKNKQYEKAYKIIKVDAGKGDPEAQYYLGKLYEKGKGIKEDFQEALYWYNESAKKNNSNALYRISQIYFEGERGIKKILKNLLHV